MKLGDTIALIAPAGRVTSSKVREAVRNIQSLGYKVKIQPGVYKTDGYLAGSDPNRLNDLLASFRDPEVKMILCLRGGYGSPRLLELIDFEELKKHPKIFVGYSDITALLIALSQKSGFVTFHGPMAMGDFSGKYGLAPYSSRYFWNLLQKPKNDSIAKLFNDWGAGASERLGKRKMISPGVAEGELIGGNLSTLVALLGTPYEIDTRGKILFLEDVNEEPFRIDRMLLQLHLAGKLKHLKGVVLGGFTRCVPRSIATSFSTEEVLKQYLGGLNIPVMSGFAAGHLPDQATLPFGSKVRLDASQLKLSLLESPVKVEEK